MFGDFKQPIHELRIPSNTNKPHLSPFSLRVREKRKRRARERCKKIQPKRTDLSCHLHSFYLSPDLLSLARLLYPRSFSSGFNNFCKKNYRFLRRHLVDEKEELFSHGGGGALVTKLTKRAIAIAVTHGDCCCESVTENLENRVRVNLSSGRSVTESKLKRERERRVCARV